MLRLCRDRFRGVPRGGGEDTQLLIEFNLSIKQFANQNVYFFCGLQTYIRVFLII